METPAKADVAAGYMPQLDSLRAIAALLVIHAHWIPTEFRAGLPVGGMGVQLFFVLSGFLITGILLRYRSLGTPEYSLRAFYARRALRIFPLYYLVLGVTFLLNVEGVREILPWHATYLSNLYFFLRDDWNGYTSHFWTLAVEEQFYLVWPLVLLLIPENRLVLVTGFLIGTGAASQFVLPVLFPKHPLLLALPFFNFAPLGSGALLALAAAGKVRSFPASCILGIPAFLLFQALRMAGLPTMVTRPARELTFVVVATWLIGTASTGFRGPIGKVLSWTPLLLLGRMSYGVYILHHLATPTVRAIGEWLELGWLLHGPFKYAMRTVLTFGAAWVSYVVFEGPLNRLKDRFPYRRP